MVKAAAIAKVGRRKPPEGQVAPPPIFHLSHPGLLQNYPKSTDTIIASGASTGGTEAMKIVLTSLPRGLAPNFARRLNQADPGNRHRPFVDVMFNPVAIIGGPRSILVLITGIGCDGAQGLMALK